MQVSDKLFQKLVQIFEKVRVRDYGSSRDYQSSTFYHIAYAYYIVYPINENEIKMLLHIATEEQLTLSVISTGKNWGYGSKQPRKSVSIIVDLSLMNQIIYLNPKELYARIQPGVTQLQMVNYLQKHYPNLILDLTGGPLSASIIGNALTHGHGIGMLGNHADAIFNLSVILPNQKRIESGNLRFNTAKKIAHLPGHILGPNFDKLFNQSEYGIVIESSVQLTERPAEINGIFVSIFNQEGLDSVVELLRKLRREKIVACIPVFSSANRILLSKYLQSEILQFTSLEFDHLCIEQMVGPWNLFFAIMGDEAYVTSLLSYLVPAFNVFGANVRSYSKREKYIPPYVNNMLNLLLNEIDEQFDWSKHLHIDNKPETQTGDPNLDYCGEVFISIATPFQIDAFEDIRETIELFTNFPRFIVYIQAFHFEGSILNFYVRLCFDRKIYEQKTPQIVRDIVLTLLNKGYMVSRPSHLDYAYIQEFYEKGPLETQLQHAFDPNNLWNMSGI